MFNFTNKHESISINEVSKKLQSNAILVDIRNEDSFIKGHIKGAINIPMRSLHLNLEKLDKEKEILIICHMGRSSKLASRILSKSGFSVKNVKGGMMAWNGPVVSL